MKAADPRAGGLRVASADDAAKRRRFVGVHRDRLVGFEVSIALYGEAELAAHAGEFSHGDMAEFRAAES